MYSFSEIKYYKTDIVAFGVKPTFRVMSTTTTISWLYRRPNCNNSILYLLFCYQIFIYKYCHTSLLFLLVLCCYYITKKVISSTLSTLFCRDLRRFCVGTIEASKLFSLFSVTAYQNLNPHIQLNPHSRTVLLPFESAGPLPFGRCRFRCW